MKLNKVIIRDIVKYVSENMGENRFIALGDFNITLQSDSDDYIDVYVSNSPFDFSIDLSSNYLYIRNCDFNHTLDLINEIRKVYVDIEVGFEFESDFLSYIKKFHRNELINFTLSKINMNLHIVEY